MTTWYSTTTNKGSAHEQGLIIDDETGRNVAVSYEKQDAKLIAAAPELLEFAQAIIRYLENGSISTKSEKKFVTRMAWDVVNKATQE